MDSIERFKHKGRRITIEYQGDTDGANPREDDNLGVMLANGHRNYNLGDFALKGRHSPYDDAARASDHFVDRLGGRRALYALSRWLHIFYGATVVKPLWLIDHSGISMSTGPFAADPGRWDSGVVGVIFDDPTRREEWGNPDPEEVDKILSSEVKYYDAYLTGMVIGYRVEAKRRGSWVEIDACWGYLYADKEDLDNVRSEAKAVAKRDKAEQDEQKAANISRVSRYLLVRLDVPDGSGGAPDPEKVTERVLQHVHNALWVDDGGDLNDVTDLSFDVRQVYPGDKIGGEDA
jgi:hypothetical protein